MVNRSSHHYSLDRTLLLALMIITLCVAIGLAMSTSALAQTPFNTEDPSDGYNAYYMAVLSALVYEDEELVGESYDKLGLSRCPGLRTFKMIDEVHEHTSGHLSTDGTRIFLSMRGTDDFEDIINNLKLLSTTRPEWGRIPIHRGFSELAVSFIKATHLYDKIRSCGVDKEIYLGGHSLGGALANIIAVELKLNKFKIKGVYTYGSPRVGGEPWVTYFNKTFPQQHFQWRNIHDPIPSLPKGALMYKDFDHLLLGKEGSLKVTMENLNPFDGKGTFSYHNKKKYAFDLWKKFSLKRRIKAELSPLSLLSVGRLSSYCSSHDHCQKDQYCSTAGRNRCKFKKQLGSLCLRSVSCRSGRCTMGQCSPHQASETPQMKVVEDP